MPLAVIKLAEGGSTNRFCEGQVQRGAANRIAALKLRFTVDIWEAIVASARGASAFVLAGKKKLNGTTIASDCGSRTSGRP